VIEFAALTGLDYVIDIGREISAPVHDQAPSRYEPWLDVPISVALRWACGIAGASILITVASTDADKIEIEVCSDLLLRIG
jgi:hypothetical protein